MHKSDSTLIKKETTFDYLTGDISLVINQQKPKQMIEGLKAKSVKTINQSLVQKKPY